MDELAKRFALSFVAAAALGCGVDRAESDGLRFELDRAEDVVRIRLATDSPYERVAFPSSNFGYFDDGKRRWDLDGREILNNGDTIRDKPALRGLEDVVVVRKNLTLTVRCHVVQGARLTINVQNYAPDDERALNRADVHVWTGAHTLF